MLQVRQHESGISTNSEFQHAPAMIKGDQPGCTLVRWFGCRHKNHLPQLQRFRHFLGRPQMAKMNRIKGSAHNSYTQRDSLRSLSSALVLLKFLSQCLCRWEENPKSQYLNPKQIPNFKIPITKTFRRKPFLVLDICQLEFRVCFVLALPNSAMRNRPRRDSTG